MINLLLHLTFMSITYNKICLTQKVSFECLMDMLRYRCHIFYTETRLMMAKKITKFRNQTYIDDAIRYS